MLALSGTRFSSKLSLNFCFKVLFLLISEEQLGINNILLTWRFWCFCLTNWNVNSGRSDVLLINFLLFFTYWKKSKSYYFYYFSHRVVLFLLLICFNLQLEITTQTCIWRSFLHGTDTFSWRFIFCKVFPFCSREKFIKI